MKRFLLPSLLLLPSHLSQVLYKPKPRQVTQANINTLFNWFHCIWVKTTVLLQILMRLLGLRISIYLWLYCSGNQEKCIYRILKQTKNLIVTKNERCIRINLLYVVTTTLHYRNRNSSIMYLVEHHFRSSPDLQKMYPANDSIKFINFWEEQTLQPPYVNKCCVLLTKNGHPFSNQFGWSWWCVWMVNIKIICRKRYLNSYFFQGMYITYPSTNNAASAINYRV